MMGITTFFADLAYVALSTWQNEKVYKFQTWRLIPISSSKLYLGNILSGFVGGLYLVVAQIGLIIVSAIPILTSKNVRIGIGEELKHISEVKWQLLWSKALALVNFWDVLSLFIAFFLFAILVYSAVSTIDLSSKVIADFLPEKFNKVVRFCIILVLTILGFILLGNLWDAIDDFGTSLLNFNEANNQGIWLSNVTFLILDIILSGINMWLLSGYHEGK